MSVSSPVCAIDQDACVSLDSILASFHCGIKEEQAWALIHQTIVSLEDSKESDVLVKPKDLMITTEGVIHPKTWRSDGQQSVSLRELLSEIAVIVYKALDYGLTEDEELVLSPELQVVFDDLFTTVDEGIEAEEYNFDKLIEQCSSRITDQTITDIDQHYRNVCRALVAEALELSTFLTQVSIGNQELKKIRNDTNEDVDLKIEVWAHVWMKVMRELRLSYTVKKLKKCQLIERQQKEYELTPFEMLLDDINSRRYKLKKVTVPKEIEKDARTVILDYIRSQPRLKPVSERQLSPLPKEEPCLHQKIMEGIKSPPTLRKTPKQFERKYNSVRLPRGKTFSIYSKSVAIEGPQSSFQRLSFANLSLRKPSFLSNPKINPVEEEEESQSKPFWRRLLMLLSK